MLLRFWEGHLWSASSRFCDVHNGLSGSHLHFPVLLFHRRKQWGWGCSLFLTAVWNGQDSQWKLVVLSLPPCPDHSNCSSSSTQSEKESSRNVTEGSDSPTSASCLPLMQWPATIPTLSQRLKKDWCHSTNSISLNHCRQWLSLQALFLSIFWFLLWSLLCPALGIQLVKDNW